MQMARTAYKISSGTSHVIMKICDGLFKRLVDNIIM